MPAARYEAKLAGHEGEIFSHLPFVKTKPGDRLAADGVTCSVCHQISPDNFGKRESFVGGFKIDTTRPTGERPVYGPFKIEKGQTYDDESRPRRSSRPRGQHIRDSELCATCHTLFTQALGRAGPANRRASRAGALSGMAAQRLQDDAELPDVPHADRQGRCADLLGPGRAADRHGAPHVRRRQLLHAAACSTASAYDLSVDGAAAGARGGGQPDDRAPAERGGAA